VKTETRFAYLAPRAGDVYPDGSLGKPVKVRPGLLEER
jgi:hypothetical protein